MSTNYIFFNPHPQGKFVGDCVKRALVKATSMSYSDVQIELNRIKREVNGDKFNDEKVIFEFLRRHGFVKRSFPAVRGEKRMTVEKLSEISDDTWVCHCAKHMVCVTEGAFFDTWDCGEKCVCVARKKFVK